MSREAILKKFEPSLYNILYILHELQGNNTQHYIPQEDIRRRHGAFCDVRGARQHKR